MDWPFSLQCRAWMALDWMCSAGLAYELWALGSELWHWQERLTLWVGCVEHAQGAASVPGPLGAYMFPAFSCLSAKGVSTKRLNADIICWVSCMLTAAPDCKRHMELWSLDHPYFLPTVTFSHLTLPKQLGLWVPKALPCILSYIAAFLAVQPV